MSNRDQQPDVLLPSHRHERHEATRCQLHFDFCTILLLFQHYHLAQVLSVNNYPKLDHGKETASTALFGGYRYHPRQNLSVYVSELLQNATDAQFIQ